MASNFKILKESYTQERDLSTVVAIIDGEDVASMQDFYNQLAKQLALPNYFGKNLDALLDCLCDFSWLETNKVHVVFKNYDNFLGKEPQNKRWDILAVLNDAANEWKAVRGSEKIKFEIFVEPSQRIKADIEASKEED